MTGRRLTAILAASCAIWALTAATAVAALPTASTGQARPVTATSATLNGIVNPRGEPTTYYFEYGTTRAYGSRSANQGPTPASQQNLPVSAGVSGLAPGTDYHFRLVAVNGSGTRLGRDRTFTALASLTFLVRPTAVTFGAATTLSGRVSSGQAGRRVTLREDLFPFDRLRAVANTTVDAAGGYGFSRAPTVNTRYQVAIATRPTATESAIRTVLVRLRVSLGLSTSRPLRGRRVTFSGTVAPAHNGRTVVIQRFSRGAWRFFTRGRLVASANPSLSRYLRRPIIRLSGLYRVRVGSDADHTAGASVARRIRVR